VNCTFSKELLALHVEGDLPDAEDRIVANHLLECNSCREFLEQLGNRQAELKLLRRDTIHSSEFLSMRREVLSRIEKAPQTLGWPVRIERALFLGFRRHVTVFACLAIAAVVSATLFAQMRQNPSMKNSVAVFAGSGTLVRPDGYRDWISIGSSTGTGDALGPHTPANAHHAYIDRSAYREFSETGKFPEGAVLMLEIFGASGKQPIALTASVKDSKFDGGWGYFDFTNSDGTIADKAQSILDKSSCRSCHEERARFDHVFTQFHPVLKTAT
jgi:hypothetical protein